MAQKPLSILISGAGVAGATLALAIARHPAFKLRPVVTLLERSAVTQATGQAIDVRGPGVDVIRQLGLEASIKSHHTSETGMAFVDSKGGIVAKLDATGDAKKQVVTSEYEILRSDLVNLLINDIHDANSDGANVDIVYGESIASLKDTSSGVNVTFKHNKLPQQTYDVVLGADGVASQVRALAMGAEQDFRKPSGMYVCFYTAPRITSDENLYKICFAPGGISMHLRPHGNNKTMGVYLAINSPKSDAIPELDAILKQDVATQKAWFQNKFSGAGWQSERFVKALDTANDFYATHWCQVRVPKWTHGRTAFLGDAAWATMGIGTSTAMMAGYIIAGELSRITCSADVPQALEDYEKVFRGFTNRYEKQGMMMGKFIPQTAWGVSVFQIIAKLVFALRIPQIATSLLGGEDKEEYKLPDYGFGGE